MAKRQHKLDYKFIGNIANLSFVERIILFGSRARGNARSRSDIDIAVDCPRANDLNWLEIMELVENADTLLKVDCIRYDVLGSSNPLRKAIDRDGIIIYGKNHE